MKISETLWNAANARLWDGISDCVYSPCVYSCSAAAAAEGCAPWYPELKKSAAVRFLQSLGCNPRTGRSFDKFPYGPKRQSARYAWLMFASMYAEEQGL